MKIAVAALTAIVAVLAWLLNAEMATSRQLGSQLADKTARENLELQEKCALQAAKIFDDPFNKAPDRDKPNGQSQSYQSHFNAKLGKCFVEIRTGVVGSNLMDAYEQRDFATYIWYASDANDKSNSFTQPKICKLTPSTSGERECQNYEEYKAFVANYME